MMIMQASNIKIYSTGVRRRIGPSCNRAVDALRSIRDRLGRSFRSSSVQSEQRHNFAPYARFTDGKKAGRPSCWTVNAFCLSSRHARRVPGTVGERETLVAAGLGEKKVVIPNIDCSWEDFKAVLVAAFPKLNGSGGFDLLRCVPNSKQLEVISLAVAQSPKLLKSVVANGKVFIRPIQKDLHLDQDLVSINQVFW